MSEDTMSVIDLAQPAATITEARPNAHGIASAPARPRAAARYIAAPMRDGRFRMMQRLKRTIDVLIVCVALIALAPIAPAIAVAIKIDSPGPVFYTQRRVGRHGRVFNFYKFRSMVAGADDLLPALAARNDHGHGPIFKMRADPRKTRVGVVLRRFSLDELPQVFNVLRGDMSIVGPRPALEAELAGYQPWQHQRMLVPQGMTGKWQVGGRSELTFDQMMELDLDYVHRWSFWTDIVILLRTIPVVITGRGAY